VFRKFLIKLFIFSILVAISFAIADFAVPMFASYQSFTWLALIFFFLLNGVTGFIGFRALKKSPHGFVASVNGIVALKILLCVVFVVIYMVVAQPNSGLFIISFFILYVIYTVFEIRELIAAQKNQLKQKQDGDH